MDEIKIEDDDNDYEIKEYIKNAWKKKWKEDGSNKKLSENTDFTIDIILHLLGNYRVKCLLGTIIDVDDLIEKFYKEKVNE